jgi:hypothetical protein
VPPRPASAQPQLLPLAPAFSSQAVVEAFSNLVVMVGSEFEDVAVPAAQSVAALSVSSRVRAALGASASEALKADILARQQQRQQQGGSSSALTGPAAAAAAAAAASVRPPALRLFETLLGRACSVYASPESRTICAIALAKFASDAQCASVLLAMGAPSHLLTAVASVQICAPLSALRRECLRAVAAICKSEDAARAANAAGCDAFALRLTQPPYNGDQGEFNALAADLARWLASPACKPSAAAAVAAGARAASASAPAHVGGGSSGSPPPSS